MYTVEVSNQTFDVNHVFCKLLSDYIGYNIICFGLILDRQWYCFFLFSDAFENARFLCDQYYLASPDCIFQCTNRKYAFTIDYTAFILSFSCAAL